MPQHDTYIGRHRADDRHPLDESEKGPLVCALIAVFSAAMMAFLILLGVLALDAWVR